MTDFTSEQARSPRRIGILLVHGIGEQRRFEHLDWQGRDILRALQQVCEEDKSQFTVEIASSAYAQFHADADGWSVGPKGCVRALRKSNGEITHEFIFHEVWWADVNETYSLAKQVRFWLWGLAIWAYPKGRGVRLHGFTAVTSPRQPKGGTVAPELLRRGLLMAICSLFLISLFPFGIGALLIQRVFSLQRIRIFETLTNFLSGVKIFNQRVRFGPGFSANADFLDTLDEPPRVSVRRRVVRSIADMAQASYDAWYIVAHSQGTVAAFNGLMETPFAWPGYFAENRWREFCARGFGGPGAVNCSAASTMPRRPAWAGPNEIAYRAKIFERFGGLLTLGSPLETFAAIWPARVPISRIPAFPDGAVWINVFDPVDPVSGPLKSYGGHIHSICPEPKNIGYAGSWLFLLSHLGYLTWNSKGRLAESVARWFLCGDPTPVLKNPNTFSDNDRIFRRRSLYAWMYWFALGLVLVVSSGVVLGWASSQLFGFLIAHCGAAGAPSPGFHLRWPFGCPAYRWPWKQALGNPVLDIWDCVAAAMISMVGTFLAGVYSRLAVFRGDKDPIAPPPNLGPIGDPAPPTAGLPRHMSVHTLSDGARETLENQVNA